MPAPNTIDYRDKPWLTLCLLVALSGFLSGCVSHTVKSTKVPAIKSPSSPIAEDELLDVGIAIFDPGLEEYDGEAMVYPEVRKAEARFMPRLLSQAMEQSGAWGAVRVVPDPERISDLSVHGTIVHSDGESLELEIVAKDARGIEWMDKTYRGRASAYAYKTTTRSTYDPFQMVYNTIANDLLELMQDMRPQERKSVRLVSELLFAQQFSPEAYSGYLAKNPSDTYIVTRLPAENDPMLERIQVIRERDHLYIDTMQEYYSSFNSQMQGPYQDWRELSYDEAVAMAELKSESQRRMIAGVVAIAAGIAGATSSEYSSRAAGNVAIIGGGYLLKSGLEKRAEAAIHVEALEELGQSLEAEITPQVIQLEDRSVKLSGNVEDQYAQWRSLLKDIYAAEIGDLDADTANP